MKSFPASCVRCAVFAVMVGCGDSDPVADDEATPPVAWVVVQPAEASVLRGGTYTFAATTSRGGAIEWFASDTLIAKVSETDALNRRATIRAQAQTGSTAICARSVLEPSLVGCATIRITN